MCGVGCLNQLKKMFEHLALNLNHSHLQTDIFGLERIWG